MSDPNRSFDADRCAALALRARADNAQLTADALQRAIFNSAMFSKIATDARGVIQIFNVGAEHMLGYAAADVVDKLTPADISDPQELIERAAALSLDMATATPITPGFESMVFKATRGIEDIYELTYIRKDGSRLPAVVSVTALRDPDSVVIGYLLIGTDNTARKQAEGWRREANAELERAKSAAEQANLAKSDFLSSMSHELRSPLNAILGFAQLMESGTPPPTSNQKESIDQILQAGWYLLELINEVLDLSLIESGKLSLSPESVSIADVLADCQAMIEPLAEGAAIRTTFPIADDACFVNADRTRVKQVLLNLLSNAIKYNRVGGEVDVTCASVAAGRTRVSFRDTGRGLSTHELAQLFEPFNRLGQEFGAQQGTGIGLVVSKRLIELMGGAIGVESTVGVGSTFWIELESTRSSACLAAAPEAMPPAQPPVARSPPRRTLLYIEDNPANLMLVARLVERRADIRLLTAREGRRGIELARSQQPAVILMDINLPGISGIEAMAVLADDVSTAHIPVIALSANAMPHDLKRARQAGFFEYLTKPINVAEFMNTVDRALRSSAKVLP